MAGWLSSLLGYCWPVFQVTTSSRLASRTLVTGETEALEGFPLQLVALSMRATTGDGKTQTWTSEVDFRRARRASLLIVPDPYGRFRPRVSIDGKEVTSTPP